jgi:hypothetical protein
LILDGFYPGRRLTFAKTKNLRMKKMRTLLPLVASLLILSTSCNNGGASSSDPKAVLIEFFKRMEKKDIDGAAKLTTKDSKSTMEMMKKGMEAAEKMKDDMPKGDDDPSSDFKDVEFGDAKITGETAVVPINNKKENKQVEIPLKKEDGEWKVDFSMATLMKMGMDAKDDMGMDEDGNNVNPEDLQKSMEAADSMMKNMDPEKMKEAMKALEKLKDTTKNN